MKDDDENVKVLQVSWHRNGVGGEGFHAVIFTIDYQSCPTCGGDWGWKNGYGVTSCENRHEVQPKTETRKTVASVFEGSGRVAVFDVAKLQNPDIGVAFGENSWRGDRYEGHLRRAIEGQSSDGAVKFGPFGLPTKRKAKST